MKRTFIFILSIACFMLSIGFLAEAKAGRLNQPQKSSDSEYIRVYDEMIGHWHVVCDFSSVTGKFAYCTGDARFRVSGDHIMNLEIGLSESSAGKPSLGFFVRDNALRAKPGATYSMKIKFKGSHKECKYGYTFDVKALSDGQAVGSIKHIDKSAIDFTVAFAECDALKAAMTANGIKHNFGGFKLKGTYEVVNKLYGLFRKYAGNMDM